MVGILKRVPGGCIPLLLAAAAAAQELPRADFAFGADVAWVDSSGYPSYLEYSAGKLRHDPDNDGLLLSRAWFDYRYRVLDTVTAQVAGEAYDDDIGGFVGLTEAYLEWKPLAVSPDALSSEARCILSTPVARERRSRLEQPVYDQLIGHQYLGRRGDSCLWGRSSH